MMIYVYRLTVNLGGQTPSLLMLYLLFAGIFLTHLRRPTGALTVTEQKLEGEFRYVNSRLITNSEEVAFYQGNNREKLTLLASFSKLTDHLRKFLEFRVGMGIIDNFVAKCKSGLIFSKELVIKLSFLNKQILLQSSDSMLFQCHSSQRIIRC